MQLTSKKVTIYLIQLYFICSIGIQTAALLKSHYPNIALKASPIHEEVDFKTHQQNNTVLLRHQDVDYIRVNVNSAADYLMLVFNNQNFLSKLLTIVVYILVVFYIHHIDEHNIFSRRKYAVARYVVVFFLAAKLAAYYGYLYTTQWFQAHRSQFTYTGSADSENIGTNTMAFTVLIMILLLDLYRRMMVKNEMEQEEELAEA
ncbi:hypothetical protein [Mucilaginibacter sp. PPCGB 2223]|uniref:hypothetical protein n=1 Tax=Mucilaginibacter sp. PPCGB 2223 TaxID=1886027 RepID=UPI001111DF59|nr:hypothetical protein [Mucilaginibacter sp. PPCGB 2223]